MAGKARFATAADVDRKASPGEVFCFWPLAKVADELGCSERQVKRGVRSLRAAGFEVRRRVQMSTAHEWERATLPQWRERYERLTGRPWGAA